MIERAVNEYSPYSADLARSITREASAQTYYTIGMLVDRDLVPDAYRAYAYFRWVDDLIDSLAQTKAERLAFIRRQKELLGRCIRGERLLDLTPEEWMLVDLLGRERTTNNGLRAYASLMMDLMEFDASRRGRLVSQEELAWYPQCLGKAVTEALHYFIGNRDRQRMSRERYLAATAAHITHMLRDTVSDLADGYFNIPSEYLEEHRISQHDIRSEAYRIWVRNQVDLARKYFKVGKRYLASLENQRLRLAGYAYCARFEGVLETIESDGYFIRRAYGERQSWPYWLKLAWLGATVPIRRSNHDRSFRSSSVGSAGG